MKYTKDQIKNLVLKEKSVRISFVDKHEGRHPIFGKLVLLSDGEELLNKGFVRLVRNSELQSFEGNHPEQMYGDRHELIRSVNLTKLFVISDFNLITEYEN